MKILKFLLFFILLSSIPVMLLAFLQSPQINILKPTRITYGISKKGNLSNSNIPSRYHLFEKLIQSNWTPPNINKKQALIIDTADYSNVYSPQNKLRNSAEEAFGLSMGQIKNYKINTAKYKILFEYNPANNLKNIKILRVTEKQDNYNSVYFIIIMFALPLLPLIIIYLIYYSNATHLINTFAMQLRDKGEYVIQSVFKNLHPIFLIAILCALANMFFMLSIGYIGVFEGFNQISGVNKYASITNISIFNAVLSLILVYYYELVVVLTSKRVIEFKDRKISKELYFDDIYRVEESLNSSDIGGGIKIVANRNSDISINMAGDPLKLKKKILELVSNYKKENNIETTTQNNMERNDESNESAKSDTILAIEMMANPDYAKSVIIDAMTPNETELPDVRYCQYCGAEFSANINRCPVCEKLND